MPDIFDCIEESLTDVVDSLLEKAPSSVPPTLNKKRFPTLPGRAEEAPYSLQKLAKDHTEAALNTILNIMNDPYLEASTRLEAAKQVLDRGWGKSAIKADFTSKHISIHAVLKDLSETVANPPKLGVMEEDSGVIINVRKEEVVDAEIRD